MSPPAGARLRTLIALAGLAMAALAMGPPGVAAQLHKCVDNGAVTYQNTPCPASEPRQRPTVDQLNADRQKKLAQARAAAASAAPAPTDSPPPRSARPDADRPGSADRTRAAPEPARAAVPAVRFSCDGRTHCAQMTSCAEATYFLAKCPGAQMDGNGDGIPCEKQWCGR
jgi:Excalibur calcium-binding domain